MKGRFYRFVRDLHLYFGLFISPYILVFAISVFFLVHAWLPGRASNPTTVRVVPDLPLPANLETLSGRALLDALQPALAAAGVQGEAGFVQHRPKENRLIIPITVPGRVTTVTIDLAKRSGSIEQRDTGLADALVLLHKSPGPHLVAIRMNWVWMRIWRWLADATVYLVLFISASGIYLWYALRAERPAGVTLVIAGAITFFGLAYALSH
jgi:hypothetical protein